MMKQTIHTALWMMALSPFAAAQAEKAVTNFPRQQVTLAAGGAFTRKVTDSGITYKPTSSGAAMIGYRYNILRWLGVEADYDLFQNSQKFNLANSDFRLQTNVHVATGSAVLTLPNPLTKRIKSDLMIGGGAMIFNPRSSGIEALQIRNTIAIGGGMSVPVTRHIAIRAQAQTFLYKAPDFSNTSLHTNKYVQTMVPTAGVVFSF